MGLFKPNVDKLEANKDVEGLITALSCKKNNQIRIRAADALVNIVPHISKAEAGLIEATGPLIAALKDDDNGVRKSAAIALGYIGKKIDDTRAVDPLVYALKDKDREVQKSAVIALCRIGDNRAVEPLIAALKDKDSWVQKDAAEALAMIGDNRAVEPLIAALKDKAAWLREAAAIALGRIGDNRAVEPLIAALKDKVEWVRLEAANALGKFGDQRAVKPLTGALKDKDLRVRKAADLALQKINPEPEIPGPSKVSTNIFSKLPLSRRICPECMRSRGIKSMYKVIGEAPVGEETLLLECPTCGQKTVFIPY